MSIILCPECGREVSSRARTCPHCGFAVWTQDPSCSKYEWITTFLLCFFLGELGIHSFYTGKTTIGIIQLLTFGGCGIWWLVDLIMLACGSFRDGDGKFVCNR